MKIKTLLTEYERSERSENETNLAYYEVFKEGGIPYLRVGIRPVSYRNGMIFTGCNLAAMLFELVNGRAKTISNVSQDLFESKETLFRLIKQTFEDKKNKIESNAFEELVKLGNKIAKQW